MTGELLSGALNRIRSFNVVACVTTAAELLSSVSTQNPAIALVSANLQDGRYSGFKVLKTIRDQKCTTRCVLMVDYVDRDLVIDAFRAGARGIFRRSASIRSLCRCVSAVHQGQVWAGNEEIQHLLDALQTAVPMRCANSRGENLLSMRERQIIPMVADGLTNKEMAQKLAISEHTIKNHLFRIYEKLGISSRVELVLYAVSDRKIA
jgi:DNA-binding NarL/FixJ family response regulator